MLEDISSFTGIHNSRVSSSNELAAPRALINIGDCIEQVVLKAAALLRGRKTEKMPELPLKLSEIIGEARTRLLAALESVGCDGVGQFHFEMLRSLKIPNSQFQLWQEEAAKEEKAHRRRA